MQIKQLRFTSRLNCNKQRKVVVELNKKSKFEYFNKYDQNKQTKPFWVNCNPYCLNKHRKTDTNIMLSKNGELIMENQDIANTLIDYFGLVVVNLNLFQWNEHNGEIKQKMLKLSLKTSRKSQL